MNSMNTSTIEAMRSPGKRLGVFAVALAVACFLAYLFSGHSGIYTAQRVGVPKTGRKPGP